MVLMMGGVDLESAMKEANKRDDGQEPADAPAKSLLERSPGELMPCLTNSM